MTFRSLLEPVVLTLIFSRVFAVKRSSSGELVRDHVLSGHTFSYCNVNSLFSCAHRCLSLAGQCESYSYATAGEHRGLCALNGPGTTPSGSLTYKPGFVFVRVLLRQVRPRQNKDTLWRQHCVLRCCPSVAKRGNILRAARTQQMFLKICRTDILWVLDTKFVSDTNVARVAKRIHIWDTWSRQQCFRHNVSLFCRGLKVWPIIQAIWEFWCRFTFQGVGALFHLFKLTVSFVCPLDVCGPFERGVYWMNDHLNDCFQLGGRLITVHVFA